MTQKYGIQITDANGESYVLLAQGKDRYQTFNSYAKADDYNYEFEDGLPDGYTSAVVAL